MPLPPEVLTAVKAKIDEAEKAVADAEDVLTDLKVTGIGVGEQETKLKEAKAALKKLRLFYDKQLARVKG